MINNQFLNLLLNLSLQMAYSCIYRRLNLTDRFGIWPRRFGGDLEFEVLQWQLADDGSTRFWVLGSGLKWKMLVITTTLNLE